MMDFWIIFGLFGLFAVPTILLFVCCGDDAKHKIGGSLVVIIIWMITAMMFYFQEMNNREKWNNGFCECGQHWELSAVDNSKYGTVTKYYTCPDCHAEIEIIH